MIFLQLLLLLLWLIIIPFCIGLLAVYLMPEKDRTMGVAFVSGYLLTLALFELVGIPIVITVVYHGFTMLSYWFMSLALVLALAGAVLTVRRYRKGKGTALCLNWGWKEIRLEIKLYYVFFFLLLGFQMYMAFTRASFDGDDSYYGVQGLIAQQLDTLYRINPNTGRSSPLDVRHALALVPIWEAFVGRMSGIHATIIAHSVVPMVFLPLTYLLYWQIGKRLLRHKRDMLPVFMIVLALFQMFGHVSIYTNETFFLTRTWQGKSLAGNFIFPAVYWLFLCLFEKEKDEKGMGYWMLLGALNLAAGASSSLAVLLSLLLTAGLAVLFAFKERSFRILFSAGLSCIPGAVYIFTYLVISR